MAVDKWRGENNGTIINWFRIIQRSIQYKRNARRISERAQIQSWLDCWVTLAKAEAKNGVIPESAAKEIAEKAHAEDIDMDYVREGFKKTSHPLMPQIRAFTKLCSPEAGGYIHWGATT